MAGPGSRHGSIGAEHRIGPLLRELAPQVLGAVVRRFRDFAACEDAVADETPVLVAPELLGEPEIDPGDTLALLFMCCHEALSPASAIALTLRAVGGLTTAEIAKAFLVPEATMAQRISRANQSIKWGVTRLEPFTES